MTIYTYDSRNRLKTIDYADTTRDPDVAYTYYGNGDRKTMTDAAGLEEYGYTHGRLTSVTRGTKTFSYDYNTKGQLTKRTYPDTTVTTYTYNTTAT